MPGSGGGSQTSRAPAGAWAPLGTERGGRGECLAKVFGHMSRLEPAAHTGRAGPWHDASCQKSEGEAGLAGSRSGGVNNLFGLFCQGGLSGKPRPRYAFSKYMKGTSSSFSLAATNLSYSMSTIHLVPDDIKHLYHVREWRNAAGVLATACPLEWQEIIDVLRNFRLLRSEVVAAGGSKSPIASQIDQAFYDRGWIEKQFRTEIRIDDEIFESPTHKIDCLKGRVALELEWNNKDPFFDRDLNNFRLLFDLRAIDVGVIITRASELQAIFKSLGKGSSYGASTTHHEKLWPRIEGGGGGGCPVITFAIKPELYVDDGPPSLEQLVEAADTPEEE